MQTEDLKAQIHHLRNICGSRRQFSLAGKLQTLSETVIDCGKLHPYALNDKLDEFVARTKIFSEGLQGKSANISNENYLYRVQSLRGFLKSVEWSDFSVNAGDAKEVWNMLVNVSKRTSGGWLPLERFVEGTYPVKVADIENLKWWNYAWWTTHSLWENVILGAAKIGMCSTWLSDESIVFRASVNGAGENLVAYVPTVVDAFLQPIFHPVEEMSAPNAGITIDLSSNSLEIGVDEYVIKPIDVEAIEIFPILISNDLRRRYGAGCEENAHLLNALVNYYRVL